MLIKEQRGEICPLYAHAVGDLPCEECDHWKHKASETRTIRGIPLSDEWCDLISEEAKDA